MPHCEMLHVNDALRKATHCGGNDYRHFIKCAGHPHTKTIFVNSSIIFGFASQSCNFLLKTGTGKFGDSDNKSFQKVLLMFNKFS